MNDSGIRIVALAGTFGPDSSTGKALNTAIRAIEATGATVATFNGGFLSQLPHYGTAPAVECPEAQRWLTSVRQADGLLIASPGWHGSIPGQLKNALDYLEETARDERIYLDGLPVGLIATAYGWQATGSTLAALRAIVHALRGWPTPLGAAVNCSSGVFDKEGCTDAGVRGQLESVGRQVVELARLQKLGQLACDTNFSASGPDHGQLVEPDASDLV